MTSTVTAALGRLVLGWGFAALGLLWVLSVQPATGPAATVFVRELTKADLPALPLLVAGGLLSVLAVVGRRARSATISTLFLCLFGAVGWLSMWWLAIEPAGEGAVVVPVTPGHGITESDVVVIPAVVLAAVCGLFGLFELLRSMLPEPAADGSDPGVPVQAFFRSTE